MLHPLHIARQLPLAPHSLPSLLSGSSITRNVHIAHFLADGCPCPSFFTFFSSSSPLLLPSPPSSPLLLSPPAASSRESHSSSSSLRLLCFPCPDYYISSSASVAGGDKGGVGAIGMYFIMTVFVKIKNGWGVLWRKWCV